MKVFISFLNRIASYSSLAIVTLIYISFPAYFLKNAEARINELSGKTVGVIDLTMGYNPVRTISMLHDYSPDARAYYASVESSVDVVYPLVYAFFFAIILVLLYRKNRFGVPDWIVVLPFVAQVFDYIENYFIVKLLTQFPTISDTNVALCETAKFIKWAVFFVILLLVLYGVVRNIVQRFSQSKAGV